MKSKFLKLPGAILLTREQQKFIIGNGRDLYFTADEDGGGSRCSNKCTGDYDCGGVNKYCVSYYCNPDGTGGSFKQCGPN